MLRFAVTLFAVITSSTCQQYGCLEGDTHKEKPSPEPNMHECTLYSESSCCYANFTEQLAHSPVIKVSNSYWNRCGQLSKSYEACKDDSICAHNWLTDWDRDDRGENHCRSKCVPYSEVRKHGQCDVCFLSYAQMYANGTDMCQNMWGESFKVSEASCLCLQMNKKDMVAIKHLLSESSEESSSISSSEEHACQKKLLKFEALQLEEGEETR
ncbi:hypothetical protein ASZ78_000471 [Callipepla squamata]|uniref:Folate receptor-like domain-containing protein n=1 Tax=Callipepla squamata TaxID=9009 RepID=A0A226NM25_CALSU|nr:hypothetical protein ASZ78_000471 [Callipepla squamata]